MFSLKGVVGCPQGGGMGCFPKMWVEVHYVVKNFESFSFHFPYGPVLNFLSSPPPVDLKWAINGPRKRIII